MPTLEGLFYDDSLERVSDKYRVAEEIQTRATLAATALQMAHRAEFPIAHFTPGSPLGLAALTNTNVAQSIRNAYAAAVAAGGGTVLIPAGVWAMGASGGLVFDGQGQAPGKSVLVRGAGSGATLLVFPTPWTTTAVHFFGSGDAFGATSYCFGGMQGVGIYADAADVANTGIGLKIDGCIYTTYIDIDIRNFQGGHGWECKDYYGSNHNSQYIQFYNCRAAGNDINFDLDSLTNSQAMGMFAGSGQTRDFVFRANNMLSVYGGFIQSDAPTLIELIGDGNNRLVLSDMYYEGANAATVALKCQVPAVASSQIEITRFHLGGSIATFADIDAFTGLKIDTVYRAGNATKILKARNSNSGILLLGVGTPQTAPGAFDLDEASASDLVALSSGHIYASKLRLHNALQLGLFADGAEPGTPLDGQAIWNTSTSRPRFYSTAGATWRDAAYADDPVSLTDLLTPYAEAIFDVTVARSRDIVSNTVNGLTDVVNGATAAPSGSGARPAFTASDPLFGGQSSFTCELSGAKYLAGTFHTSLPIGTYQAMFVVFRLTGGAQPSEPRVIAQSGDAGGVFALLADDNNFANDLYGLYDTPVGGITLLDYHTVDATAHQAYAYTDPADTGRFYMQMDRLSPANDPNLQGALQAAQSHFYLGTATTLHGGNVAIAYVAFLKSNLPSSVLARAQAIARARFAL